ncbi:unnamed protein product [Adineta steineri]|uniref:Uncharacterized protein n=1 Tax=Adineta steineri TaxID=433720 RepID=A0A815YY13_9BILA|nr:unnamed protein product [Adineta steineri]CAF1575693.1 unnamed protein product [Adineta steineri]
MEGLLVCTKDNQSIDIWHCVNKTLIERYLFDVPIVECSTIERYTGVTIRVTLENGLTHYLITRGNQGKICFQLIGTLTQKLADRNIFLNFNTDVYYCENQSYIYLYHFERPENDRLEKIDNLPLLNSTINRQSFFSDRHESALIWLAIDSVVVFHSCGQYFLIPGEYHELYTKCQSKRNFICCLNRNQSRINIYEWKLHESVHTYRLLANLQLDEQIFHWACQIDAEWGFIVYCTLANGELPDDYSVLAMWDAEKKAMELISISLNNNIKIRKISALQSVLVFYDNNQQVYWWNIERKQIIRTLHYDPCKTNATCRTHEEHTDNNDKYFTEDGKYLFEISQKESLLLMYSVDDSQLLEKLFIDSLLPHIEVLKDRLILCSNNELILLCINETDSSSWIR